MPQVDPELFDRGQFQAELQQAVEDFRAGRLGEFATK